MIRNKLLLLGVSSEDIDAMAASGKASPRLVIRSPQTGYVIEKKIVVGSSVEAKMTLLEVADLSKVWIEADVYEKDIAFLQPGQSIEATVEAFPNSTFTGKLALVYPKLDTATRTNRVRFELDNPQYRVAARDVRHGADQHPIGKHRAIQDPGGQSEADNPHGVRRRKQSVRTRVSRRAGAGRGR